jgi:hypothetical protein
MTSEKRIDVEAIMVRFICDCGGELKYTGKTLYTTPPKHEYQCQQCKRREISTRNYPYIEYREKKNVSDPIIRKVEK